MPTSKRRLNVTIPKTMDAILTRVARRDNVPTATKAAELLGLALEIEEDAAWSLLTNTRDTKKPDLSPTKSLVMTYTVVYHPAVVREDIPALGAMTKNKSAWPSKKLTTYPDVFGKPLRQSLKGYRKLRVGDWRVIFRIENKIVKIFIIGHRSMVYKEDDRRW